MQFKSAAFIFVFTISSFVLSDENYLGEITTQNRVALVQAHTPSELSSILERVDRLLERETEYPISSPIALVLHGDEVDVFLKENYNDHRELVDLAARLDAFNMIDIQVCETWMRLNNISAAQLPAFINTVPYGPAVERELLDDGYEYF